MSAVFISYRRDDSAGHTGRLYDHLREEFGKEYVFRDIDTIEPGTDFVEAVENGIKGCSTLIVVIGNQWLSAEDELGRRLKDPNDFVRLEIASALKKKLRIIPVLVQGAKMPPASELPDDIAALARRHALEISDSRWNYDVGRLISTLSTSVSKTTESPETTIETNEDIQLTQETADSDTTRAQEHETEAEPTETTNGTPRRSLLVIAAIGSAVFLAVMAWQYFPETPETSHGIDEPMSIDKPAMPDTIPAARDAATTATEVPQLQEPHDQEKQELLSRNALRIEQLLVDAEKDMAALRLTSPKGNNAHEKYNRILEIEPGQPDAEAGIRSIAEKYIGLSETSLHGGDLTKAGHYLDQARHVYPAIQGLTDLQLAIEEQKQQQMIRQQAEREAQREREARIEQERIEREQKAEKQAALTRERIQSCLMQCEERDTACKNTPVNGKNECESRVEAECEKVHQACLGDPQVSMTWGEIGAESECLGRWSQCMREEAQQCQEVEEQLAKNCETAFSLCRNACQ